MADQENTNLETPEEVITDDKGAFETAIDDYLDLPQPEVKENNQSDKTADDTKKAEDTTNEDTKNGKKETKDGKTNENTNKFDLSTIDLKGKWNGEELPVSQMIEKAILFAKDNPEDLTAKEIISNIQKVYDYSTVKNSLKELETKLNAEKKMQETLKSRVLAQEYGGYPPVKAIYDPLSETNGEIEEIEINGKQIPQMVFNDRTEFLKYENYSNEWFSKANEVKELGRQAFESNKKMGEEFQKNHPEVNIDEVFNLTAEYTNASMSMGTKPFPPDTLEVFWKGKNFDTLVKSIRAEERQKVYDELNGKKNLQLPNLKNESQKKTVTEDDDSAFGSAVDEYLSGNLTF